MATKSSAQVLTAVSPDGMLDSRYTPVSYAKHRLMRTDPTISLARKLLMAPIVSTPWSISSTDGAPEGAQEFIDKMFQPLRTKLMRAAMIGWLDYGWQPFEKIITVNPKTGQWEIKACKSLLQDFTDIVVNPNSGDLLGVKQQLNGKDFTFNLNECMVFSFDYEGTDWYGTPMMAAVSDVYDNWNTVEHGAKRYDKKIAGSHWVIKFPVGTTLLNGVETDNAEIANQILNTLVASGGIAIPQSVLNFIDDINRSNVPQNAQWDVQLLTDGSTGRGAFTERQKYLDALKMRGLDLPERSALEGQFGTKAEAEAHADFAILNLQSKMGCITEQTNEQAVNQMLRVNYGEEYINTVYIESPQFVNSQITFLRSVYTTLLANPDAFMEEQERIDADSLRDTVGVPYNARREVAVDPNALPTIDDEIPATELI